MQICQQINIAKLVTNDELNVTEKIDSTGNCKESELFYAAQCYKHRGHTLDIQENNFQSGSPNIATTSKTGQTAANFQNIFTKVTI